MLTWLKDTAERVGLTYAETFLGLLLLGPTLDLSTAESAAAAALPAALAVLKAAVAALRAGTVSPASLVKPPSP
jgi:hypothetical protein